MELFRVVSGADGVHPWWAAVLAVIVMAVFVLQVFGRRL